MAKEKKVKEPKLVKPKKASKKNEIEDVKTPLEVGETFAHCMPL